MSAQRPAGLALGALAGQYPSPGLGLVPAVGMSLYDDFLLPPDTISGFAGDRFWQRTTLSVAPSWAHENPSNHQEAGVLKLTTAASSGSGGLISYANTPFYRYPPVGSIWAAKINLVRASDYHIWSGFSSVLDRVSGVANDFVGIRQLDGLNLYGVVRNNSSETVIDLNTSIQGVFVVAGFEVLPGPAIQFFTINLSAVSPFQKTNVGAPITTNLPNERLYPIALGVYTTAAAIKQAYIDWWVLGGRSAR